jgi:Fur family transcriptional regulator, stress-responsive regulator
MHSPSELTQLFRARGLKITPQRQAIFAVLQGNDRHPTAEGVYAEVALGMPAISLRTVYQTLNDLVAMGEIRSVELGSGAIRFDPNESDHHHLVCDACGLVRDVALDTSPLLVAAAAASDRFTPSTTEVVIHGRCASCVAAST